LGDGKIYGLIASIIVCAAMFLTWHSFSPKKRIHLEPPRIKATKEVSIVIPVKDNQKGIDRFFEAFLKTTRPESYPLEILVVGDAGAPQQAPEEILSHRVDIRFLRCNKIGPASARNLGWRSAKGDWILFTDSDCLPTSTWLEGYLDAWNGAIGYAGNVLSLNDDAISSFYESQGTLTPTSHKQDGSRYPEYLITANALVWKPALVRIGGFNERIKFAAGEDINLGFRLREVGNLSFAPESVVYHNFDDGVVGFVKRFRRYGRGNRLLSQIHSVNMMPRVRDTCRVFLPRKKTLINFLLACTQYLSLWWGYHLE